MPRSCILLLPVLGCTLLTGLAAQEPASARKSDDGPALSSIGPIAFAPDALLISDPKAARILAVATGELEGDGLAAGETIAGIDTKLAGMLGVEASDVRIVDIAVHSASRQVFVAATRGRGPDATPVVVRVTKGGEIALFELEGRKTSSVQLPNPPQPGTGRRRDQHLQSITDLAYVDNRVVVAGLSNEEFASKLRVLDFPFDEADKGASIEIYHGAHGKYETRSPVRTFVPFAVDGEPSLLAAYTCTPLVQIKLSDLAPGTKVLGKTVAELGNRNRPIDMVAYEKDDVSHLLIANSSRGVMKVSTAGIAEAAAIKERVSGGGTAGLTYDTIDELKGVEQLDKLDDGHAVILVKTEDGAYELRVIELP